MNEQTLSNVEKYLGAHRTLLLGTVSAEGQPMVATVSHVNDGATVYFMTDSGTRKAANISSEARVAFSVAGEYEDWMNIKGVQAQGVAAEVTDPAEAGLARKLFMKKFPQVTRLPEGSDFRLYRITPSLVYFIDNTVSWGHRETLSFTEGRKGQ